MRCGPGPRCAMLPREAARKTRADRRMRGVSGMMSAFAARCSVPRPSSCRPLGTVLQTDAQLGRWTARQREEAALTKLVRRHLPRALAERVRVAGVRDGVVELTASGGAIAAALRQRTTTLPDVLRREGVAVTSVR
ncbi:MAG TPA: DciA family protein, partial [Casimicrobiaceae bacterium]